MITDRIENIGLYKNIPQNAVNFIKSLKENIPSGRHEIGGGIYANVEEYYTKPLENCRFEAHRNYIDVQILLRGHEKIYYTNKGGLNVSVPYDTEKDIEFFSDSIINFPEITLNGANFMMIFPHEAHAPQTVSDKIEKVLKVVVKINI